MSFLQFDNSDCVARIPAIDRRIRRRQQQRSVESVGIRALLESPDGHFCKTTFANSALRCANWYEMASRVAIPSSVREAHRKSDRRQRRVGLTGGRQNCGADYKEFGAIEGAQISVDDTVAPIS
jgi:hypothetical protein